MNQFPTWASTIHTKCAVAILSFVLLSSVFSMVGHESVVESRGEDPTPLASPTYYAIPTEDPDDGKFLGVFGSGLSTLSGLETIIYIGVPSGETSFDVGVFDADITNMWDYDVNDRGVSIFALFKDPLKDGDVSMLLDNWTSEDGVDDQYMNRTYSTDTAAQAPSGNYFYRLEVRWADPTLITANLFKVRSTGQLSLAKNQEFGFAGAPQNFTADPCVGQPGNTYDGAWNFSFYLPKELEFIQFRDGDLDRAGDTDDANTPNVDPDGGGPAVAEGVNEGAPQDNGPLNPYGSCAIVTPSVNYTIIAPDGAWTAKDTNPSGDKEWENFRIEHNNASADFNAPDVLPAGVWELVIEGLDGHNGAYFNTSFEMYTTTDPPLPVNPPPKVHPNNNKTVPPGVTVEYGHIITNDGLTDNFDLTAVSSNGWTTRIYKDSNRNGKVDPGEPIIDETGNLGKNQIFAIVVQVDVPLGTDGMSDKTVVTASSQNEWAVQGYATDITIVVQNVGPLAEAGGPYTVFEGSPVVFDGSGSSDPEGDPLEFRWDFESDSIWDTSWSSGPTASKTWGDDFSGIATLEVRDPAGETSADTATWAVINAIPSANMTFPSSLDEGQSFNFKVDIYDPGSDDIKLTINWGDGTVEPSEYFNNGVGPDPYPSPDINPVMLSINATHVWGDNGIYLMQLRIEDDDGGVMNFSRSFDVRNLDPLEVSFSAPTSGSEGDTLAFESTITDPGSDDLTFDWDWGDGLTDTEVFYNDGVGPDPNLSPLGTYPFNATSSLSHPYGDDGSFGMQLIVTDDDGGTLTLATTVVISNLDPSVLSSSLPGSSDEGDDVTFTVEVEDPGSDDLILEFDWGDGTTETVSFFNDGVGPDPYPSPWGVFPFQVTADVHHIFGDNGDFTVTVTVSDDDGGSVSLSADISVTNVDPSIDPSSVEAKAIVDLTLRVSGEKWHDVSLEIMRSGTPTQLIHIVRMPGNPDEQSKTEPNVTVNLFEDVPLIVRYTPLDDPINGKLWGSTPVWVILVFGDGTEVWLDHTFNVRHPNTWIWEIRDISTHFIGKDITFGATASDVGSDDLTFEWDWGDGTTSTSTYFNDGVGPDPFPSPDVNPITVTDTQMHAFFLPKVYTVTITVTDDDGGFTTLSFTLQL